MAGSWARLSGPRSRKGKGMKTVLFVCVHNAGRSQMAEAFTNKLAQERGLPVRALSAGTVAGKEINPVAVAVMLLVVAFDARPSAQPPRRGRFVAGEILVKFRPDANASAKADAHRQLTMLHIVHGACAAAVDVLSVEGGVVDDQVLADLRETVERIRAEIERLTSLLVEGSSA